MTKKTKTITFIKSTTRLCVCVLFRVLQITCECIFLLGVITPEVQMRFPTHKCEWCIWMWCKEWDNSAACQASVRLIMNMNTQYICSLDLVDSPLSWDVESDMELVLSDMTVSSEKHQTSHRWWNLMYLLNTSTKLRAYNVKNNVAFVFIHFFIPVWHPRWTVLLLFGTFRSDSECLYSAPVKMAFICFLWAASSCKSQPAVLDHKYTSRYSCCVNTIDIQGVDLPLPWCLAPGQLCVAPVGVSLLSPGGKHVATSQSAPAKTFISPQ